MATEEEVDLNSPAGEFGRLRSIITPTGNDGEGFFRPFNLRLQPAKMDCTGTVLPSNAKKSPSFTAVCSDQTLAPDKVDLHAESLHVLIDNRSLHWR